MDEYVGSFTCRHSGICHIKTSIKVLEKGVYRTESGKVQQFSAEEMKPASLSFKIALQDPYWTKISRIKAKWYIKFGHLTERSRNRYSQQELAGEYASYIAGRLLHSI